jgi:hypothetical protein
MCFCFYRFIILGIILIFNNACIIHHSSIAEVGVANIVESSVTHELQYSYPPIYLLKIDISKELYVLEHPHLEKLFKGPWKVDNENWLLKDKTAFMDIFNKFLVVKIKNG